MTDREGFYGSLQEAEGYLALTRRLHMEFHREELVEVTMNYHFGSMELADLEAFIASLSDHGFDRCDAIYIDPDEYAEGDEAKFHWIPGKTLVYDADLLLRELHTYERLASAGNIIYGGIIADDRQGIDD